MATSTLVFNPFTQNLDFVGTPGGAGSITITGDSGGPQTASSFAILGGTGGIQFDWDGASFRINSPNDSTNWAVIAGTSSPLAAGNGYITTNGALTTLTLPASVAIGDTLKIVNAGGGGISIAQNANQGILLGNDITTLGIGGSVTSSGVTQNYSSLTLVCVQTAPNELFAATSIVGIFGVI